MIKNSGHSCKFQSNYLSRLHKNNVHSKSSSVISKHSSSSSTKSSSSHSSHSSSSKLNIAKVELVLSQREEEYSRKQFILEKHKVLELQIERGKLTDARNKLKLSQLKEEFPSNFNLESRTLNPVFADQSLKSLRNLEKVPFKMKSCNDNILNRPVLKQNSNPTSQNTPLDNHHANLQLSLKPESHIDISHSDKIPIESYHHNKQPKV